ncbi:MAG: hypothetical protein E6H07_13925 [Bacteroidetes bacterium]|nr:MAG: hypothetical protein E6H07_13925 [Bacteroidota bacterium]
MKHTFKYTVSILVCICIIFFRCIKEYSVEGVPPVIIDTIQPPVAIYVCPSCPGNETFIENKWSMRDDTLLRCGIIDTAIVAPDRTGFTFYGPSACSADTGIVMTIIFDTIHLNRDLTNITSRFAAFYYYDNVGQTYIYMSKQQNPFTVIIDSYNHQTRLASGTFSGFGYRTPGGGSAIRSGKFKMKLM